MLTFALAVVFLIITPGPGVLSTAGVGAAFGFRAGFSFVTGLCLGGFMTMMLVITGIAAIVLAVPWLRAVLLFASVGYLTYLAWRVASAGSRVGFIAAEEPLGFLNGFMLQFINPKAYVVATTLFSGFAFMPEYSVTLPGLMQRPLIDPAVERTIALMTVPGRPHSPALGAFMRAAQTFAWPG